MTKVHNTRYNLNANSDPVYFLRDNVANAFATTFDSTDVAGNNLQKEVILRGLLETHPEGIVVLLNNGGTHFVTFNNYSITGSSVAEGRFNVCDPAATTAAQGFNVPFNASYSSVVGGFDFSSIVRAYYITN